MRKLLLFLLFIILSGCSPLVTQTPPPPPQPIQVAFTSTMQPFVEMLHQCALDTPEIALILRETSATHLDFASADLTLWFGEPSQGIQGYAASLGMDKIIVIVGSEVELRNLNATQLREMYAEPNSIYKIWTYTEGNELRAIFDDTILEGVSLSPSALLAPNPAAMIEAIAAEPMAIGYLPQSWHLGDVQTISIARDLQAAFEHPILGLTNTEPQGNLLRYLVCLQQSGNP